ncbi:MAG: N4-gp56 family major capsid protein [Clostridia bacterium]|nr:N4-gp56 family major capsid protein [Clostridia bacterium]MBQ3462124.1 N4-gp56 family major capsid protein [Clostridia bacterium]MBQ3471655.1 N4-gp56 family major capsid protein [Clostridia bacterium]MBQ9599683.1 N4-gp56 family major capsid protein [Clostridia bacterium]MBR0089768.1 N4-gp56 family major capsid protein [Clostridia bacterium]
MALGFEQNYNMNKTTSAGVQPLYTPVLNRHVLETMKEDLIYSQFGQRAKIEKGKGKVVAWDKMLPLPKATTPLTEGVTPKGVALNVTRVLGYPQQYGQYVATTDEFDFFTPDPTPEVLRINELLGNNAAETFEYLTKKVLAAGTNVQYAGGKAARAALTSTDIFTTEEIAKAVRTLKGNRAKKKNGGFVGVIHPDVAYDLMTQDDNWKRPHEYQDTKKLYKGEIGEWAGVRFVESPDAIMFRGDAFGVTDDRAGYDELTVISVSGKKIYIEEEITSAQATAINGASPARKIAVKGHVYTISSVTAGDSGYAYITISDANDVDSDVVGGDIIYPGEGTVGGAPVYATIIMGADAFGVSDPKDIETIIKQLGSGGTADPLNQRATQGWKCHHLAKRLTEEWMVRVESVSTRYAPTSGE